MGGFASLLAAACAALAVWIAGTVRISSARWREWSWNIGMVTFSLVFSLFAVEWYLSTVVETNGFGGSLPNKRWSERYWTPSLNTLGYRDREPVAVDRLVLVVGDSFPSGAGIAAIDDRMGDQLANKLGKGWSVATVAQPGWDTSREFEALKAYPRKPNVVFVSYFLNDIEVVATKAGRTFPNLIWMPPPWLQKIVDDSEIANWAYWRFATASATGNYIAWLRDAYSAPDVLEAHLKDMLAFKVWADGVGAALCFVMWPILVDLDGTAPIIEKLAGLLRANGVAVIDMTAAMRGRGLDDRIVSRQDPHPSVASHGDAARLMYQWMVEQRLASRP